MIILLLFFGSSSSQLFPFWFFDIVDIFLFKVVLILDVGVCGSIGEVALATLAQKIAALRILALASRVAVLLPLHQLNENYQNQS